MENKNLPAFPINDGQLTDYFGVSKREYFAAHIAQGYLASYAGASFMDNQSVVNRIIQITDLLLSELEK